MHLQLLMPIHDDLLHILCVQVPIDLRPRPIDSRPLALIQYLELYSTKISYPPDQSTHCIYLPDQCASSHTSYGWVA